MNILVLSKRQYMGKDLLDDEYGRFYEIPRQLAEMGHQVSAVCLSYRKRSEYLSDHIRSIDSGVSWYSVNLGYFLATGIYRYFKQLDAIISRARPDIIYGCSDAMHAILAKIVARRHNIRFVVDLYDNFDSYGATNIPGIRRSFHHALASADGITVIGTLLKYHIQNSYNIRKPIITLGNAINSELFYPRDKSDSRRILGLPENGIFIGTAGALYENRDIQTLYDSYTYLRDLNPDIHLVLAGPRDTDAIMPSGDRVHDLGVLAHERIPDVYSALDIGIICNKNSDFGNYCYPQKFFEMLSCGTPVIGASTGELTALLSEYPRSLYQAGNAESLTRAINLQINKSLVPDIHIPDWQERASTLDAFFNDILHTQHS